jgi:hypothetical protein
MSVGDRYLAFAQLVKSKELYIRLNLFEKIEQDFVEQCDTELGDFLNDYALLMLIGKTDELERELDTLIFDHDLNPEMLHCVADSLYELITVC